MISLSLKLDYFLIILFSVKQKTEWLMAKIVSNKLKTKERKYPTSDKRNEADNDHKLMNQVLFWAFIFVVLFIIVSLVYAVFYSIYRAGFI